MTRKLSLTTAVAVAALSVGASAAFGADRLPVTQAPVLAQPDPMIEDGFARAVAEAKLAQWMAEDGFDRAVAAKLALQSTPRMSPDAFERIEAATQKNASTVLGYSDSVEGASVAGKHPQVGSLTLRASDSVEGALVAGSTETPVVSATSSGTEIEWPQVGVGLGIGILLALGLGLIIRVVHVRPFAH